MSPVNFLVQPQDLDEINGKLDTVLALLERWDRERQEAKSVTVPIRTTADAGGQADLVGLSAAPKQKRRAPSAQPEPKPRKRRDPVSPVSSEDSGEATAAAPSDELAEPAAPLRRLKKRGAVEAPLQGSDARRAAQVQGQDARRAPKKTFVQKSDPPEEGDDDDFVIEKM